MLEIGFYFRHSAILPCNAPYVDLKKGLKKKGLIRQYIHVQYTKYRVQYRVYRGLRGHRDALVQRSSIEIESASPRRLYSYFYCIRGFITPAPVYPQMRADFRLVWVALRARGDRARVCAVQELGDHYRENTYVCVVVNGVVPRRRPGRRVQPDRY